VAALSQPGPHQVTQASAGYKHYAKKLGKYQIFQKIFLIVKTKASSFQKDVQKIFLSQVLTDLKNSFGTFLSISICNFCLGGIRSRLN
jgi:hypothetical protein